MITASKDIILNIRHLQTRNICTKFLCLHVIFQVEELDRKNISTEAVQNIITKLSNLTDLDNEKQQEKRIKQQDLIKTVEILQKIVDLNISDGNLDILAPASNILDSRNRKSWKNMEVIKFSKTLVLMPYGFKII